MLDEQIAGMSHRIDFLDKAEEDSESCRGINRAPLSDYVFLTEPAAMARSNKARPGSTFALFDGLA